MRSPSACSAALARATSSSTALWRPVATTAGS